MRVAIIGGGISGIVAAHSLIKCGQQVAVFEKSAELGGVWALGYPGVRLQNTGDHYRISDVPWTFITNKHPTSGQIREYLNQAVIGLKLVIRSSHEVIALVEHENGWLLKYCTREGEHEEKFDFVIVAIGQYTEGKHKPDFPGEGAFKGEIITDCL